MGASPEQVRNGAVLDTLALVHDIWKELEPVQVRLDQRRRTRDEHTDYCVVTEQRRRLLELRDRIALLTPDRRICP